jgi:branched-chain amino acid aminotransferase
MPPSVKKPTVKSASKVKPAGRSAQAKTKARTSKADTARNGNGNGNGNGHAGARSSKTVKTSIPLPAPANQVPSETKPLVYVNGRLVPKNEAMVSVYDHGLLYGDGIFEGIRIYRGRIFKCEQHMDRLWRSAEGIRMTIPVTRQEMVDIQRACIEANNIEEGYIRLVVTRGYGTLGLDPRKCPVPGIICIADQIQLYPKELYESGMKIVVAKRPRVPIACLDPRIKSLNYLNNILAKCEAIDAGCHEAIMLNTEGFVSECTGDNIFIVKNGIIYTPPSDAGILEGITRQFVMDTLARDCGVKCVAKQLKIEEVLSADEVFLTGSAAEIIAVKQIDETRVSNGEGPVTRKLRLRFREIVTSDAVPED